MLEFFLCRKLKSKKQRERRKKDTRQVTD